MTNFILVQEFDPIYPNTEIKQKPFFINVNQIIRIDRYNPEVHAAVYIHGIGDRKVVFPEGALESIYVTIEGTTYHLDAESSKKVLEAIGAL